MDSYRANRIAVPRFYESGKPIVRVDFKSAALQIFGCPFCQQTVEEWEELVSPVWVGTQWQGEAHSSGPRFHQIGRVVVENKPTSLQFLQLTS